LERLQRRTGDYLPDNLPAVFDVVHSNTGPQSQGGTVEISSRIWEEARDASAKWELGRKWLYGLFFELTLLVIGGAWWFWIHPPVIEGQKTSENAPHFLTEVLNHMADVFNYVLPVFFKGLVTLTVLQHPLLLVLGLGSLFTLWGLKGWFTTQHRRAREKERALILKAIPPSTFEDQPISEHGVKDR